MDQRKIDENGMKVRRGVLGESIWAAALRRLRRLIANSRI